MFLSDCFIVIVSLLMAFHFLRRVLWLRDVHLSETCQYLFPPISSMDSLYFLVANEKQHMSVLQSTIDETRVR